MVINIGVFRLSGAGVVAAGGRRRWGMAVRWSSEAAGDTVSTIGG
jgi:hypothetical protein